MCNFRISIKLFQIVLIGLFFLVSISKVEAFSNSLKSVPNVAQASDGANQTSSSSSASASSIPKSYTAVNWGRGTISCKLGITTESNAASVAPETFLRMYERQLNTGWYVGYADTIDDINSYAAAVNIGSTLGQNIVILPCSNSQNCKIKSGAEYAQALWNFALSTGKPVWAYSGYHESNVNISGLPSYNQSEVIQFTKDLTAGLNNLAYATGIQDGLGYKIRGLINVISPELSFSTDFPNATISVTPEDYLSAMRANDVDFGEFKGLGLVVYTPEEAVKAIKLAQKYKIQAYITAGIRFDSLDGTSPLFVNDKRQKKFELEIINQYINNSNVAAIFVKNGLTIGTDTPRQEPVDAYNLYLKMENEPLSRYGYDETSKLTCTYMKSINLICNNADITGDRKEPISISQNSPMFYESQLIEMLDAAGCSNIFQYSCTNENVIRSNEKGELLFSTTDKSQTDPKRRTYDQTIIKARTQEKVNEVSGYVDYTDMRPILQDFTFTKCASGQPMDSCEPKDIIVEKWKNVVVDVEFSTSILNTAEVNVPLVRSLSSLDANGTSDLNFATYPAHIARMGDDQGTVADYTRKADGNVFFDFPEGKKLMFPIPELGNVFELYSLDKTDYKLTSPFYTPNTKKNFLVDRNFYSKLTLSTTSSERIEFLIKSISQAFGVSVNYEVKENSYTAKAFRTFNIDHTYSDLGMKDYPTNGLTYYNQIITHGTNFGDREPRTNTISDSTKLKIQLDSSEVTSGEGSINITSETNFKLTKPLLSQYARAPKNPLGGILSGEINWSIDLLYGGADCENPNIPAAEHTINGIPQQHSGELPAFQMAQLGAVIACYDKVKRILSPDQEIVVAGETSEIASLGYVLLEPLDGNMNHQEFHPMERIKVSGEAVDGLPGGLNILRTAWSVSNRISKDYIDTSKIGTEELESMNICHPVQLDTRITAYNKFYSVANTVAGNYVKPIKLDEVKNLPNATAQSNLYCANVKNEARSGYRRPLVQLSADGTQIATATAAIPWMGTVNAIFEDVAKRGFNTTTGSGLELPDYCKLPENSQKQECLHVPRCGTDESKLAVACLCKDDEPQYMGMEIYLCQKGMLEFSELIEYGLINPKYDPLKEAHLFNPQGCLFNDVPASVNLPNSSTPSGGGPVSGPINSNCTAGIQKFKDVFIKVGEKICIPPEVVAGIWRQETNCSYPDVADVTTAINTLVYPKSRGPGNNSICTACMKEMLGSGYDYINSDRTYIDSQVALCKQKGGGANGGTCGVYSFNVQCCDVRGPFQFLSTTFYGVIGKQAYLDCRAAIGSTGESSRERFGDALCSAAQYLKQNSGTGTQCSNWSSASIQTAAGRYYGSCGQGYCANVANYAAQYKSLFQ